LAVRLPFESLTPLLEQLANLTASQTIDTSIPNTALRVIVDTLPHPQTGQPASQNATTAYSAVLIKVVTCFGPLLQESELVALQASVMAIIQNDTAGTVVTKRALTAISALVLHFSDSQLNGFVSDLSATLSSSKISMVQRRHLIAAIGVIARTAPAKFGPHLDTLAPFIFSAVGEDDISNGN
jgi:hypothetical protein